MAEFSAEFIGRLRNSIDISGRKMRVCNKNRVDALKQFVGHWYSDEGAVDKVPFNTIYLAAAVHVPHLVSQNPASLVTTEVTALRPMAYEWELGLNRLYEEIDFAGTLGRGVMDALFGIAIFKTGMGPHKKVEINGVLQDVGQVYTGLVSQNDWAVDPVARNRWEAKWMGNKFRLPLDYIRSCGLYQHVETLGPVSRNPGEPRDADLGGTWDLQRGNLYDEAEMWEIWIEAENALVTIASDASGGGNRALRVVPCEGPETGPYDILSFMDVPDNIYPLPPVAIWRDLHESINMLGRNLIRQSARQKSILAYPPEEADAAERVRISADGSVLQIPKPDKLKEISFGGVHPHSYAWLIYLMKEAARYAGNVDLLGGLGASAETLGQTEILSGNIQTRIGSMNTRTYGLTRAIARKLAWYMAYDPLVHKPILKRVGGTGLDVEGAFSAEAREGDWLDFNFKIHPYSMRVHSPETKAQRLIEWWNQLAMPMVEIAMQQGKFPPVEAFLKLTAKYFEIDEVDELIFTQGEVPSSLGGRQAIGRAPKKAGGRTNVRGAVPRQDLDTAIVGGLLSAPAGAIGRPPGATQVGVGV